MSILLGKGAFKIMTEGRTLSFDQRYYNMKTSLDIPVQKTYESITGHIWIEFFGYTNEYTITIVGLSETAWEDYFAHLIGADVLFQPFDDLQFIEKCDILELRPFYKDELLWKDAIQIKLASSELRPETCWKEVEELGG